MNNEITLGDITSTAGVCARYDEQPYEQQGLFIINALRSVSSYEISGSWLTLSSADSSQLIFLYIPE